MQDTGATRNRRTENGPSGTPAPTRDRRKCAGIRWCADAGTIMAQGTINVVRGSDSDASLKTAGAICAHHRVERGSGSGDRGAGDSVRNLFAPQLQLDEREIQKPSVFGGVLFHISFAVERNMAAGGRKAGRGCNPQSENRKRAVGDAGPYGVRLSGCAGIRETADMGATVPLHDNRPARLRVGHGSGSDKRTASDSMRNLFVPWLESGKGNPKTVGFWRRSFPYFFRC